MHQTLSIGWVIDQNRLDAIKKTPFGQRANHTPTNSAITVNSQTPSQLKCLGRFNDMINGKTEMLHHLTTRPRLTKGAHTNHSTLKSDIFVPTIRMARLNG